MFSENFKLTKSIIIETKQALENAQHTGNLK